MCDLELPPISKMVGSSLPDRRVYAYGPHLSGEDFYNKHSFFACNGFAMDEFINDDLLSALEVYYGKIDDYDSLDWWHLLLCSKIKALGRQERLGELTLGDIVAAGLPQEDAD